MRSDVSILTIKEDSCCFKPSLKSKLRTLSIFWGVKGNFSFTKKSTIKTKYSGNVTSWGQSHKKRLFSGKIYFHYDNTKPHVTKIIKEIIETFCWEFLSDLVPLDHHLFRSFSNHTRGKKFDDNDHLKNYSKDFVNLTKMKIN